MVKFDQLVKVNQWSNSINWSKSSNGQSRSGASCVNGWSVVVRSEAERPENSQIRSKITIKPKRKRSSKTGRPATAEPSTGPGRWAAAREKAQPTGPATGLNPHDPAPSPALPRRPSVRPPSLPVPAPLIPSFPQSSCLCLPPSFSSPPPSLPPARTPFLLTSSPPRPSSLSHRGPGVHPQRQEERRGAGAVAVGGGAD